MFVFCMHIIIMDLVTNLKNAVVTQMDTEELVV